MTSTRGILLVLIACNAPRAAAPLPPRVTPSDAASADVEVAGSCDQPTPSSELVASVEHGACDGRCPRYTVSLYRDGTVDYFGLAFVAVAGWRSRHVDPAVVEELARGFAALDFSKLSQSLLVFPGGAWIGTVMFGTETGYVDFSDSRNPPELTAVVDKLDALAGAAQGANSVGKRCSWR